MAVVLKFAYAKPEDIEYRIEKEGIRASGWLHPYYDDIVAFWTANFKGKLTYEPNDFKFFNFHY